MTSTAADIGLNSAQLEHARQIVAAVKARELPERAAQIALAVALTESGLRVYANRNVAGADNAVCPGHGYSRSGQDLALANVPEHA